jgi:uncharacterized protein
MGGPGLSVMSAEQVRVAERVVAEESARREHVVVYLSGAHAYGFPSPDSDLDLKCIHVAPTAALLGLDPVKPTFDRAGMEDGVEIDYTSNELGPALRLLLAGNGNFLERVLGRTTLAGSPMLDELRPLAQASLSLHCHRHYRGFATSQLRDFEKSPSAKRALYVLRTALTGMHLVCAAELVTDVNDLFDAYGFADARELVVRKREGECVELTTDEQARWRDRLTAVIAQLDDARARSALPELAPNRADLDAWLVDIRRTRL